ncbi:uncharacterized protein MYCFIDRAFT_188828 [Pseudocercospora fijiensis CIRAD86]|uniref:Uncharacterized protein n=1 Tax=Pseudocercospora fijiensis (strain CIRAD86) TaxID=383855 RepID=M3AXV2_PSEFD|nr:uncharacterized protein MYCFIDRAFT_188828 [Pseudocercospora fijiensis CIRAD86]EME81963.1 hypothetical protein MYCFIDRAFT_188828 [Pseudocercospora fijiensis CIRAD86]
MERAGSRFGTSPQSITVKWLGQSPDYHAGTTFGLPWARGQHYANSTHFSSAGDLQSWITAYWPDDSIKWTGHAIPASEEIPDQYTITASTTLPSGNHSSPIIVAQSDNEVSVNTGKITATFAKTGSVFLRSIVTAAGKTVGENGSLVLHSQSGVANDIQTRTANNISYYNFESSVFNVTVDQGSSRTLITVRGNHTETSNGDHIPWLPFILRFYLYANSDAIRLIHSLVYDGNANSDFIAGIGIRFQVPLAGEEYYNRHIRLAGVDGGLLSEAVQGITGLRKDPGSKVRTAQFEGLETPDISTWDTRVSSRMQWVPTWNDYSLTQLSPDGFTLRKRTKAGQSWVKIPGSTRSGGLAYLGGATQGGLAVGLRDFWKRYPTGLDIRNAATDDGEIIVWIYSPSAEPLDLRPYHDGLGQDSYEEQLDALEITYEDYEPGFNTPYGIARTSELFIYAFDKTPSQDHLSTLTEHTNNPPVLFAEPDYIASTKAIGTYWAPPSNNPTALTARIESNLNFLNQFYQDQVEQRRWYGFLDFGDFMHTYDPDRHTWRYDIGGYAWDNSELSPSLFFWTSFLRTGRAAIYRFAEAETRHASEVDIYHIGKWKGLGTRHGIQHWSDSAKQARISNSQFHKFFFYLSGGDERIGEIFQESLDVDQTYETLDPNRKVRTTTPPSEEPKRAPISLGTDWSALAASWLIEYERLGPRWEEAKRKLHNTISGISTLKNGFVTGSAWYDSTDGTLSPPPTDPNNTKGIVAVSHLTAVFGLGEVIADIIEHFDPVDLPAGFEEVWLEYCYFYRAPAAEQVARYGESWGAEASLGQYHSRLLAFAAWRTGDRGLARRAWREFLEGDGLNSTGVWERRRWEGSVVLSPVDEVEGLSTNDVAGYGLAAVGNLGYVGGFLEDY